MGDSTDDMTLDGAEEAQPSAEELEAAGQSALFGSPPAEDQRPSSVQPYRVLARKYRPQTFSELIGQEPMVRTLANAIKRDRLAHAFLMTGVRGVGKTSTARLIAKALNCVGPDGQGGPTIDPCGQCEPCVAIAEGRHIDVMEMDAASHTGVDDVREIIEAVRYAAVSARYKIYIIDEVHMLSRNAFNALLKTLEEPPAHVKFLFATTEVDKLPVTVLSRTQRFDLRRIPLEQLQEHFGWVCAQEGVQAEDEALHMIAAAAEGSVRDGLSILDQAIAHADADEEGRITAPRVRDMLGLADKGAQRRLFANLLEGQQRELLAAVEEQYALGVEPLALIRGLLDLTHRVTLVQVAGEGRGVSAEERVQLAEWAQRMSPGQLHRLWQLMLKGYEEVRSAPDPLAAAKMALLRTLFAADMPDPGDLLRRLETAPRDPAPQVAGGVTPSANAETVSPAALTWPSLVNEVEEAGEVHAANVMRLQVRVVGLEPGVLTFSRDACFRDPVAPLLKSALAKATGTPWQVVEEPDGGSPSLVEEAQAERQAEQARLRQDPLVKAALAIFPDAELIENEGADIRAMPWSRTA
ncbi:DNA polymerase III subunit gamma/tau [Porphyrobacter sp. GA68]|uniref:DNA polymerase III subunit gamma/tau n=1 Tax=Porphyrobacter sp. GA68 TaxID=2883480 RepID=UPI001D18E343|nr:DNA polymerase III subunit gamma/tau [Porphyrobacter sp. GA68]